ncbi:M35 family metallo-endopeptidase [Niastella populi]|uniref:Lysine-specific metallo-endopeptidase domain-containing protein n=1 Tax=Niastella populi TaxID=550983 RepID=A0A1V9FZ21_9BACT|nr:M35 family metallo-endopeptidase [Niastella populi]OQP63582.1 hypothetical protein A4R26_16520 [Niastella populi]
MASGGGVNIPQPPKPPNHYWNDWWKDFSNDYFTDPGKLATIKNALQNAYNLLAIRLLELQTWNPAHKAYFKRHFGRDDNAAKKIIEKRVKKEMSIIKRWLQNDNYKKQIFEGKKSGWAHVYKTDLGFDVFLDAKFWNSPQMGPDSQAGAIIHELSHFQNVGNTTDFDKYGNKVYGIPRVRRLISSDANQALRHADAFEYYIEGSF